VKDCSDLRIVERCKRPGLCYAVTHAGVELPIVDVTQPAFSELPDQATQEDAVRDYLDTASRQSRLPTGLRAALFWLMSRSSPLMRAIRASRRSYLPSMDTYLLKLGPGNLGAGYAGRIDRLVAASVPALSVRLRLRNMAELIAEALVPGLQARAGAPLRMVNIAGGPAMDSLNALLLLRRDHPRLLHDRPVHVHVLDLDAAGAGFGERALAALLADGGPLRGTKATFTYHRYDWAESQYLASLAGSLDLEDGLLACSSEGGLFEYGTDEVVVANLEALRRLVPPGSFMVGSVTRDSPVTRAVRAANPPQTTHPRSLEEFRILATRAGWQLDRVAENLMTFDVRLRPSQ
jgi:hypothetical protein